MIVRSPEFRLGMSASARIVIRRGHLRAREQAAIATNKLLGRFAQQLQCAAAALVHLIHVALAGRLVGTPAYKFRPVAKSSTGKMVVGDFDDELWVERFPFAGTFGRPAARSTWRTPGKTRSLAQGLQFFGQLRLFRCL